MVPRDQPLALFELIECFIEGHLKFKNSVKPQNVIVKKD